MGNVYKMTLDFILIGVQKAGTTSLFKYLEPHPQLYLLPEKEAPFFSYDERFKRGWSWYIDEFFGGAPADRLWGKATPEYTVDPRVPKRLKETIPQVKLIVVLRDPIERTYSHYRMSVRKGVEQRSFSEMVSEELKTAALAEARNNPTPTNSYVVRGEYYRILKPFYELFPTRQIRVFFFKTLRDQPEVIVRDVCKFLEIDDTFMPRNLGIVYHRGGSRRRLPAVDTIKEWRPVRLLFDLLPGSYRRRFSYWFRQWNVIPDTPAPIPVEAQERLINHYEPEMLPLTRLIGMQPPWPDWEHETTSEAII